MANLPDSLYEDYSQLKSTWSTGSSSSTPPPAAAPAPATTFVSPPPNPSMITRWIYDLQSPIIALSNVALQNLVTNRYNVDILPLMIWDFTGAVSMMLREVILAYRYITMPAYSNRLMPARVYNILLLFQGITNHPVTRAKFLKAKMPSYFFPLMDIDYTDRPLEFIRLGAIGVIAHLLKPPVDAASIQCLMDTGGFSFCAKPIEIGSTESKTLAVFILDKLLSTDEGLQYCCVLADRYFIVDDLLKKLLNYLSSMARPSPSLFKLVVSCYLKLSQKSRARDGIRQYAPFMLFDGTFANLLAENPVTDNNLKQLIKNLETQR